MEIDYIYYILVMVAIILFIATIIFVITVLDMIVTKIKKISLDRKIKRSKENLSKMKPKGTKFYPDGVSEEL